MSSDDLFLVQYRTPDGAIRLGLEQGDNFRTVGNHSLDRLLSADGPHSEELIAVLQDTTQTPVDRSALTLSAPVSRQEVWASGVTYKRSEEAREAESHNSSIYTRVYSAVRPELFFKANGYDVVAPNDPVGIRRDASWSVPEPELVIVLNGRMEVIGFTVGNDMSSRDIEGENPLYLPQAKVYEGACAVGPRIWLQPGAAAWPEVEIALRIERGGQVAFEGKTSTESLHRSLAELVDYLGRCKRYPWGALLFTGTGIVPPDSFTLAAGDVVHIRIDPIGELVNPVRVV